MDRCLDDVIRVEDLLSGGGCGRRDRAEGALVKRSVCRVRDRWTAYVLPFHLYGPGTLEI